MPSSLDASAVSSKRSKKKRSDETSQPRLNFGKLVDGIEPEREKLRMADNALYNISKTFETYQTEVRVFESKYETLQELEADNKKMKDMIATWKTIRDEDFDKMKRKVELNEEERASFEKEKTALAEARQRMDVEHEQAERKFADMEKLLNERNARETKKLEDKLRLEKSEIKKKVELVSHQEAQKYRETIQRLEEQSNQENQRINDFEAQIAKTNKTMTNEREDWSVLRSRLNDEKGMLQKELSIIKGEMAIEDRPDDFYVEQFLELQETIKDTSFKFFSRLPQGAHMHINTSDEHDLTRKVAELAILSNSEVATRLRHAIVEHEIVGGLHGLIWQAFAPAIPPSDAALVSCFQKLSQEIRLLSYRTESTWRGLTVQGLQAICKEHEILERVTNHILARLAPLTDETDHRLLRDAVADIVRKAVEIWAVSERDLRRISIQSTAVPDDETGWMRDDEDESESLDQPAGQDSNATREDSPHICVFPKISRLIVDVNGQESQKLILRGRALFDDSHLITLGRKEQMDIQQAVTDARNLHASQTRGGAGLIARSGRKSSIAAQIIERPPAIQS